MTTILQESGSGGFFKIFFKNESVNSKFELNNDFWEYQEDYAFENIPLSPKSDLLIDNWKYDNSIMRELKENIKIYSKYLKIDNVSEVEDYLIKNSDKLEDMLDLIHKIIVLKLKHFEDDAQLSLCINHDPEINDEFLKFYVRQYSYPNDFMSEIYKLRSDYSNDLNTKKLWVYVTTDFKPPS